MLSGWDRGAAHAQCRQYKGWGAWHLALSCCVESHRLWGYVHSPSPPRPEPVALPQAGLALSHRRSSPAVRGNSPRPAVQWLRQDLASGERRVNLSRVSSPGQLELLSAASAWPGVLSSQSAGTEMRSPLTRPQAPALGVMQGVQRLSAFSHSSSTSAPLPLRGSLLWDCPVPHTMFPSSLPGSAL